MIKLTRLDSSTIYLNQDLIETIEETPDTHITLMNGNRFLVREDASLIVEKIVAFKARVMRRAGPGHGRKYLEKRLDRDYRPPCRADRPEKG